MPVKVTDNSAKIIALVRSRASSGLRRICGQVVKSAEPKTPRKTGDLRADVNIQVLGLRARIQWGKDYAFIQEHTQFRRYTTPGTGPHFAERAVDEAVRTGAGLLVGGELL